VASPVPPEDASRPDEIAAATECLSLSDADSATAHVDILSSVTADAHTQPHYCYIPSLPETPSLLANVALLVAATRSRLSGVIRAPTLPYFPTCWRSAMESSRQYQIPSTPRVISPSPTPSEVGSGKDGYFGPVTRSSTRKKRQQGSMQSPPPIDEDSSSSDPEKRARARSRSPILESGGVGGRRRMSGLTSRRQLNGMKKSLELAPNGTTNGHLSPAQANKNYWREMSRSPSPLGLIPIHQKWRSFVRCCPCIIFKKLTNHPQIHKHEIPRKILHVSIGFLSLALYTAGIQTSSIHPVLLTMLIPVALTDVLRHRYWRINRFYIRCLGALMRESEVDGYNGVISYLLGAWLVMRFCPKDVGVMAILLLSWCDTAASTFGRLWGRYTPQIRKGKSLAGSIAACLTGIVTAAVWWGYLGPLYSEYNGAPYEFAFQGSLTLPAQVRDVLNLDIKTASLTGYWALGAMSLAAGLIASASEAIDLFGWDDNLTIPVLCGAGLWGFLRVFG
jgi:diacylglycerol kinase (CTP)